MEDVQLIKLDVDTKRIVKEISALENEDYFTDSSKHAHRTEFGENGAYSDENTQGIAYVHDGRARLQLPNKYEDPFFLSGGSTVDKSLKVTESCCRTYGECKKANLIGCTCKDDWVKPAFPEFTYTNQVLEELEMCKTGIAKMPPQYALPRHSDPHVKLHLPIQSNEDVSFLIKQDDKSWKAYNLPSDGNAYLVNVTKPHSVANSSVHDRIHIVGELLENSKYNDLIDPELR